MAKIYYITAIEESPDGHIYHPILTDCPHGEDCKVGSAACTSGCLHSKERSVEEKWVECIYPYKRPIHEHCEDI